MISMSALITHSVPLGTIGQEWGELAGSLEPLTVTLTSGYLVVRGTQAEMQTLATHFLTAQTTKEARDTWMMVLDPEKEEKWQELKAGIMADVPPGVILSPAHQRLLNTIVELWDSNPSLARRQEKAFLAILA